MTTVDRDEPNITLKVGDEYEEAKEQMHKACELAVSHVGHSFGSDNIWREYLNFLESWPENNDDRTKKYETIYNVYRRIIETPMNRLGTFWNEYLAIEKARSVSRQVAQKIISDAQEKYEKFTRNVCESRGYHTRGIDFDRISVPASNNSDELQLLGAWNEWMKYELTNPLELDEASHQQQVIFFYQQMISSLRFHPEVWLAFAEYVFEHEGGPEKAISILEVAIKNIPGAVILRIQIAEIEERMGSYAEVEDTGVGEKRKQISDENKTDSSSMNNLMSSLRKTFFEFPNAFTFSLWQRAVRQAKGVRAGRECFNETLPFRTESSSTSTDSMSGDFDYSTTNNKKVDPIVAKQRLAYEIYFAHAQLELEVNKDANVALRVLNQAKTLYPRLSIEDMDYIQLLVRILLQLGNYEQLRWHFQTLLQSPDKIVVGKAVGFPGGSMDSTHVNNFKKTYHSMRTVDSDSLFTSSLLLNLTKRQKLRLYKQYYALELKFGQASTSTLRELRGQLQRLEEEAKMEAFHGDDFNTTVIDINDIDVVNTDLDGMEMSGNIERRVTSALLYGVSSSSSSADKRKTSDTTVIMKATILLYERFGHVTARGKLPKEDYLLMQRCFLNELLEETLRNDRIRESRDNSMRRFAQRDDIEIEKITSRLQLPKNLTRFLYKLPHQTNVTISSELFVERLRKLVLPLRPSDIQNVTMDGGGGDGTANDNVEDMDMGSAAPVVEDVFKQRARKRLEQMQQFLVPT